MALLAQTCSQIGADAPNSKLLQSAEKSKKSESSKEKSSSDGNHKSTFKPYEANVSTREKSGSPDGRAGSASGLISVRTPVSNSSKSGTTTNSNGTRCSSNQSAASARNSPAVSERKSPADVNGSSEENNQTPSKSSERCSPPSVSGSKSSFTHSVLTSSADPALKDIPLGTYKPSTGVSPSFLGAYPPSIPLPLDLMTSGLMSQHPALKSSALSPYLAYARMKSPDGMVPVCRDPYCTGCSLSSHLLGGTGAKTNTCPAGCTQCDHATVKTSSSYLGHSQAAAAYAHAQLAVLAAASHLPYVCNWIAGDAAYCGKRFSSSEELLQHLRTHTSGSISDTSSALSMLGASGLPPTHPLLHRTYPTPPLSPLATARYHPYSKPSLLPPSLTPSPLSSFPLGHPGLPPYLSPYSLYGPRLGSTPGMHP